MSAPCVDMGSSGGQPRKGLLLVELSDEDIRETIKGTTEQATQELRATAVEVDEKFTKLDIKDFFTSGSLPEVIADFSKMVHCWFTSELAILLEQAFTLLVNQFVQSGMHRGQYRLITGCGMGLVHSSICMDLLFFFKAERPP